MNTVFKCSIILLAYCLVVLTAYVLVVAISKFLASLFADPYTATVVRRFDFGHELTRFDREKLKVIDDLERKTMENLNAIYDMPRDPGHTYTKQTLIAQEFYEYREALKALQ